jgi:hypothetical protein
MTSKLCPNQGAVWSGLLVHAEIALPLRAHVHFPISLVAINLMDSHSCFSVLILSTLMGEEINRLLQCIRLVLQYHVVIALVPAGKLRPIAATLSAWRHVCFLVIVASVTIS